MEHLYFAINDEQGCVKIGRSGNPDQRLKQLQTGSSAKLRNFVMYGDGYIEKLLHKQFEYLRMEGEWFKINDLLAQFINALIDTWGEEADFYPPAFIVLRGTVIPTKMASIDVLEMGMRDIEKQVFELEDRANCLRTEADMLNKLARRRKREEDPVGLAASDAAELYMSQQNLSAKELDKLLEDDDCKAMEFLSEYVRLNVTQEQYEEIGREALLNLIQEVSEEVEQELKTQQ